VSTTHSIVGAIVGFAAAGIGMDVVAWGKVGTIVMSWVVSPALAGIISYWLFRSVQTFILNTDNPLKNARRYVPIYIFLAGFIISLVTMFKGLKHVGLELSTGECYSVAAVIGLLVMFVGIYFIQGLEFDQEADRDFHFANVEKVFAVLMVVTACSMAFAHGSNDVANAIGPVAAIVSVVQSGGEIAQKSPLPTWVLMLGGGGIVIGLITYGKHVMTTIGKRITELTPSRGFACELAAATTVVLASGTGLPISTTHTLVGAVLGVGMARGIAALNITVIRTIILSWIVTLPAGALLSILFFYILKGIFN
jgi:PiT family inorganic phosphate transporter